MVSGRKSSGAASLRNTFSLLIGLMSRQNSVPAAGSGVTMEPPRSGRRRAEMAAPASTSTDRTPVEARGADRHPAALRFGGSRFSPPPQAPARRAGDVAHR